MTSSHKSEAVEGRRARKKRETRAALLKAALALIKKHGVYGARIEDITARADVGKGVFYNYFSSKEALLAVLIADRVALLEQDYLAPLRASPNTPLVVRVQELTVALEANFSDHPEVALLFHQARGLVLLGGAAAIPLRAAFRGYVAAIVEVLRATDEAAAYPDTMLFDAAAAVAGASAGYRSFCIAAGLPIQVTTTGATLAGGLPRLLTRPRKRATATTRAARALAPARRTRG